MQFGLQKPIFTFDYRGDETSQIIDSIKNLATSAENKGFDSFWVMDHFPSDSNDRKTRRAYA